MSRHLAREIALQVLFQMDMRDISAEEALEHMEITFEKADWDFLVNLVEGTWKHKKMLDEMIERYAKDWRVERMAIVDRNILRMAAFEMLYCPDIPESVSINEAVELGKTFGSAESGKFINGILGTMISRRDAATVPGDEHSL